MAGRVVIVDTGLCNLDSIARAIEVCGGSPLVTSDPADLAQGSHIVLPGVGAFPEAMARLHASGMQASLQEQVLGEGIPFLGVCLGMQLMGTRGTEGRVTEGLGWIEGDVALIEAQPGERIPHIGWNEITAINGSPLFNGIAPERDYYFVHSYVLRPDHPEDVAATTPYGGAFVSAVSRGHIHGVQFHPEKSQRAGFAVLRNFLSL